MQRASCAETVTMMSLLAGGCTTKRSCVRLFETTAASVTRGYALAVDGNRTIDRVVPAGPCRKALRTSAKDLKDIRELGRVFGNLARHLRTGNERAYKQATKRLDRLASGETTSTANQIEALGTHC